MEFPEEHPTIITTSVPRAFTCDYCPQLREQVAETVAHCKFLEKQTDVILKKIDDVFERNGVRMMDMAVLKTKMAMYAGIFSAAFWCVGTFIGPLIRDLVLGK